MNINTPDTSIINPDTSKKEEIPKKRELYFCFSHMAHCNSTKKNLKNNKEWYKKILETLFKFTTLFKASRTSIQSLQNIGHADYKKLKGSGIDTMQYKFMVSQSHGVITDETVTDDALIVHLGTLNNHHEK